MTDEQKDEAAVAEDKKLKVIYRRVVRMEKAVRRLEEQVLAIGLAIQEFDQNMKEVRALLREQRAGQEKGSK